MVRSLSPLPARRLLFATGAAVAVLGLAGCGGSSTKASGPAASAGAGGGTSAGVEGTSAPTTAAAAAGSVNSTCPTAAAISAETGQTFPAPKTSNADGSVLCNYTNSTDGNVVILFAPFPGGTTSTLQGAIASEAQAQGVDAVQVSGFGQAAFLFTLKDAGTNASGVATTTIAILDNGIDIDITAENTVAQVEAIAHGILGS